MRLSGVVTLEGIAHLIPQEREGGLYEVSGAVG